jgi:N-formylmaleamate deformylase
MDKNVSPEWRSENLLFDEVQLHVRRGGTGSPVLLLHGLTDAGATWQAVAHALAASHHVVVLDQRGHGKSSAPEAGYGISDFVSDAAEVISALDLAPVAVVGHSLGGLIALHLASTHPYLVSRLVMEDPPLLADWLGEDAPPDEVHAARAAWFASVVEIRSMSPDTMLRYIQDRSPRWSSESYSAWIESKLRMSPRLWRPGGVDLRGDWRAALKRVHCPTLLIRGDPELGSLVNEEREREVLALVRHARSEQIHGASHAVHGDSNAEFLALILPFLAGESAAPALPGTTAPG